MKSSKKEREVTLLELTQNIIYSLKISFRYGAVYLIPLFFIELVSGMFPIVVGYAASKIISLVTEYAGAMEGEILRAILGFLLLMVFCHTVPVFLSTATDSLTRKFNHKLDVLFSLEIFKKLEKVTSLTFQTKEFQNSRWILSQNGNVTIIISTLCNLFRSLVSLISSFIALWSIYPWLSIVMILLIPYTVYSMKAVPDEGAKITLMEDMWDVVWSNSEAYLQPVKLNETKIFNTSDYFNKKISDGYATYAEEHFKLEQRTYGVNAILPNLIMNLIKWGASLWLLSLIYIGECQLSDFVFFLSVSYVFDGYAYLFRLSKILIEKLTKLTWFKDLAESPTTWYEKEPEDGGKELTEIHSIRLENVSFHYPNQEKPVLENISFEIMQGDYIALVGLNGSGKTTLIKLICGLYTPNSGTIYYNGIPHDELAPKTIRRAMSVVFQDFYKFALSVRDNITMGDYEEEHLKEISNELCLSELFNGDIPLDSLMRSDVNDNGVNLSEGQWQRLAFARGMYKRTASMLIMDEPSSMLDAEAEERILDSVRQATGYGIRLIITHRLTCVKDLNKIIVLENGKIIEMGTHQELIKKNGVYNNLYHLQADRYHEK